MSNDASYVSVALDTFHNDIILTLHVNEEEYEAVIDKDQADKLATALFDACTNIHLNTIFSAKQARH